MSHHCGNEQQILCVSNWISHGEFKSLLEGEDIVPKQTFQKEAGMTLSARPFASSLTPPKYGDCYPYFRWEMWNFESLSNLLKITSSKGWSDGTKCDSHVKHEVTAMLYWLPYTKSDQTKHKASLPVCCWPSWSKNRRNPNISPFHIIAT